MIGYREESARQLVRLVRLISCDEFHLGHNHLVESTFWKRLVGLHVIRERERDSSCLPSDAVELRLALTKSYVVGSGVAARLKI